MEPDDNPLMFPDDDPDNLVVGDVEFKGEVVGFEPAHRAPLDIHPKLVAAEVGGAVGIIVSALALHFLDVELEPAAAAVAVGAIWSLVAGLAGYVKASR